MLLKIFFDICLLRANPQDLPDSDTLVLAALAAYGLADVIGVLDIASVGGAVLAPGCILSIYLKAHFLNKA